MDGAPRALAHASHLRPSRALDLVLDDLANTGDPAHHGGDGSFLHRAVRRFRGRDSRKTDLGADRATVLAQSYRLSQTIEDRS